MRHVVRRVVRERAQRGFNMLEILLVVSLMGILAAVVIPRVGPHGTAAKKNACHVNKGNIEVQAQLWFRNKGTWPAADLSDLAADTNYLPEGMSTCPVDGSSYTFDSATQSVGGHTH